MAHQCRAIRIGCFWTREERLEVKQRKINMPIEKCPGKHTQSDWTKPIAQHKRALSQAQVMGRATG